MLHAKELSMDVMFFFDLGQKNIGNIGELKEPILCTRKNCLTTFRRGHSFPGNRYQLTRCCRLGHDAVMFRSPLHACSGEAGKV